MINFKDPKDQTTSALFVAGIVMIVGSVVALFIHKYPNIKDAGQKSKDELNKLNARSTEAKKNKADYKTMIDKFRWNDKEDVVSPTALTLVSQGAEANHLKLVSFRPQKSIESDALVQLPVQFTVDGSFANVAQMLSTFQNSKAKLAVQQVQMAAQEGESDLVTATVSLYAFMDKPKKEAPATTSQTPGAKTAQAPAGAKTNG
ncbi:MAG: type 4a pilus biogenesis protein PilO [Armatimonadetes bacterium]|nr:type 4a pilus biogenesis protein PilO [Armatimonadota bacterium]MBS1725885.1 type 4a pilus biogenesis protein PilO [Armatimonadota bacterium]